MQKTAQSVNALGAHEDIVQKLKTFDIIPPLCRLSRPNIHYPS